MNSKPNSYSSTPYSQSKQNICPNSKLQSIITQPLKKQLTPFSQNSLSGLFNTIHMQRPSAQNSDTTKSRGQMQAILEHFNSKYVNHQPDYSNKSFLELLGHMLGKESLAINQAIEICEQYEISTHSQLVSLLQQKQATREWPLPLSSLLLTDLGNLKVQQICMKMEQQQLEADQIEIVQFLLTKTGVSEDELDRNKLMECYNDFKNQVEQKASQTDNLVNRFIWTVQNKFKQIKDKMQLIKFQKRLKRYYQINENKINVKQLEQCLKPHGFSPEQSLIAFRYFYYLQHDVCPDLIDRKKSVSCILVLQELLSKSSFNQIHKYSSVSTSDLQQSENKSVIDQLLKDKSIMLEDHLHQQQQIDQLTSKIVLLELELEKNHKDYKMMVQCERQAQRNKYLKKIEMLEQQNRVKDNKIRWYKNEMACMMKQYNMSTDLRLKCKIYGQVMERNGSPFDKLRSSTKQMI